MKEPDRRRVALGLMALVLACAVPAPGVVAAATHTVSDCGDSGGANQLRDTITAADPGDTIDIVACTITLTMAATPLTINKDLTITGAGAALTILDGGDITGLISIPTGHVTISAMTLRNGNGTGLPSGGALFLLDATLTLTDTLLTGNDTSSNGGAINNSGELTLVNSTVSGNTAANEGGGILNQTPGTLTVTNSTVSGNTAAADGGGISNQGGATLLNSRVTGNTAGSGGGVHSGILATLALTNSTVSGNTASSAGGGIFGNTNSTSTLTNVTVSGNSAGGAGGGIRNFGTLTLSNVTVSGNTSGASGGGITNQGPLSVTNSTISGNAAADSGGGIWISDPTTLLNVTIAKNTADTAGGGIYRSSGTVNVQNTIIAANTVGMSGSAPDCSGTLTPQGHNLIQDTTGCTVTMSGNLTMLDAKLDVLQRNGGRTQTHALLPGSPAIDAGDPAGCPATDQRGVPRPLDGDDSGTAVCDIGAYELMLFSGSVDLALNQATYLPGDLLSLDLIFASPGPPSFVDAYFGFLLPPAAAAPLGCPGPGDLAAAFITEGFAGVEIHCATEPLSAFPRFATAVGVPAAVPPTTFDLLDLAVPGGLPAGTWTAFFVLTGMNALIDDSLDGPDILAGDTADFVIQ